MLNHSRFATQHSKHGPPKALAPRSPLPYTVLDIAGHPGELRQILTAQTADTSSSQAFPVTKKSTPASMEV